jgi:hypothetical protein
MSRTLVRINVNRLLHGRQRALLAGGACGVLADRAGGAWLLLRDRIRAGRSCSCLPRCRWWSGSASVPAADRGRGRRARRCFAQLIIHRRVTQVIGMVSIFVTAIYGTWQNISVSILH